MSDRALRIAFACVVSVCLVVLAAAPAAGQANQPASGGGKLATPAVLAKLLPAAPAGWTKAEARLTQVEISATCAYAAACLPLFKDDSRVKVTLADTGGHNDALIALASAVITLAEDCVQDIPPATTIKRVKIGDWQAAEMWDAEKLAGEITVVVNGRFVVSVEAQKAESLEVLRALLSSVDLKALAAVK